MVTNKNRTPQSRAKPTDLNAEPSDHGPRIAALEAHLEHLATREDVEKLKTWSYSTMISGIAAIISAIISILAFVGVLLKLQ